MRKKRQFKARRCYHLVSRIAHRAFFLDEEAKNRFAELLMRVEYFSGVRMRNNDIFTVFTGEPLVSQCKNPIGACVEFKGADMLLRQHSVKENIRFTSAIRPRTGKILSPCAHCLKMLEKFEKGPVDYWQNFNLYWLPLFWLNDTEEDL